ncbi:MAG: hypothetical protein F7C08_00910 [Desulfurococcales archaeon]|nr:hypothetical protein [Desulfurococcales archaeon]MCE4605081.1 hypothetical protein [Desulfurococcales archaeon]
MELDIPQYLRDAMIVLFLASLPSVAWFFRMRRIMLNRQILIIRSLESAFKPRDKRYWVLGYLVGFAARYWIYQGPLARVNITYTVPPYHAFFYIPVIILGRKKEKLEIELESRHRLRDVGVAHIYSTVMRSVRLPVERDIRDRLRDAIISRVKVAGRKYKAAYTSGEALNRAIELVQDLSVIGEVHRVTIDSRSRRIAASITLKSVDGIEEYVKRLVKELEELSTGERI